MEWLRSESSYNPDIFSMAAPSLSLKIDGRRKFRRIWYILAFPDPVPY